jgi:hypothetical protein
MNFPCLHLEGGLISADLLADIAAGEATGQAAGDFGLDRKARLSEEIAAAWSDARAFWDTFQRVLRRRPEDDPAVSDTRERWMLPLLRVLGYDLTFQR